MKIHWSFWLIGVTALVWNVLGSVNFLIQIDGDMIESYRETEQHIIASRPMWVTIAFAVAVFVGVLASLLMLVKKALSFYFYIISFIAVLITIWYAVNSVMSFSIGEWIGIMWMPVAIALFLVWYSRYATKKSWLH